jgi:hypothetical protein
MKRHGPRVHAQATNLPPSKPAAARLVLPHCPEWRGAERDLNRTQQVTAQAVQQSPLWPPNYGRTTRGSQIGTKAVTTVKGSIRISLAGHRQVRQACADGCGSVFGFVHGRCDGVIEVDVRALARERLALLWRYTRLHRTHTTFFGVSDACAH